MLEDIGSSPLFHNSARIHDHNIIRHFSDDKAASYPFTLRFAENSDTESAFPWRLAERVCPSFEPRLDPALTFDWDLLLAQNQMSTLLGIYDCV
jgi:hypothetical protein